MTDILDKAAEWSERYGNILRASAETQFPYIYKGAVGGLTHVISVDNGGSYMELWRQGDEGYYATTGAAIKPLPGLAKGARLDEALDRFFHLMAKVEKDRAGMKRRLNMHRDKQGSTEHHQTGKPRAPLATIQTREPHEHPTRGVTHQHPTRGPKFVDATESSDLHIRRVNKPAKKAIPKKIRRLLGLKKRVMAKVDPEIGPSHSVGHRKPSDLSPESGVSKLAKRMIVDLVGEPTAQMRKNGPSSDWYASSKLNPGRKKPVKKVAKDYPPTASSKEGVTAVGGAWRDKPGGPRHAESGMRIPKGRKPPKNPVWPDTPVRKNVVALTGNQPGSGRVKPVTPKTAPGTPAKTYQGEGFGGKRMGDPKEGGAASGGARTGGPFGKAVAAIRKRRAEHKARIFNVQPDSMGRATKPRRTPYRGGRPGGPSPLMRRGRKIEDLEGGRVDPTGNITPVKPKMGGPGQPVGYGSTGQPQYSYQRKGCGCGAEAEVAKALRAIEKAVV